MEITLPVDGRPFIFSGEPDDAGLKIWQQAGFYGGKRDLVPYRRAIRATSVCLDVGANIGFTAAVIASLCPDGQIYCFEPVAQNFAHLCRTIELNNLNCRTLKLAVSDRPGTMHMLVAGPHSHVHDAGEEVEVTTNKLKHLNSALCDTQIP